MSSGLKRTRTTQVVISTQFRSLHLWWYGVAWVRVARAATHLERHHQCWRYIQVLEQHMLPSRRRLFQGRPCIFQHDNARPHTASLQHHGCVEEGSGYEMASLQSRSLPIENIWRIIKRKMRQRRPKTVEQLEACIRQEWDNIPIPKLEQLVSSVPRRLQTVIKRRGDATQW